MEEEATESKKSKGKNESKSYLDLFQNISQKELIYIIKLNKIIILQVNKQLLINKYKI